MDVAEASTDPVEVGGTSASVPDKMETKAAHFDSEEDHPSILHKSRPRSRSKVHFPEDTTDHTEILISREIDLTVDVNVGFLQTDHRYQIRFTVPDSLKGDIIAKENSSSIIRSVDAHQTADDNGHDIQMELLSHKEGVMAEPFTLQCLDNAEQQVKVIVRARILGKDQGRPMLREGILNMGLEAADSSEEESDQDHHN